MAGSHSNKRHPSFSSRLDEKLSDLSNSLVGPNPSYHAQHKQDWQSEDGIGGGNTGYHISSQHQPLYPYQNGQHGFSSCNEGFEPLTQATMSHNSFQHQQPHGQVSMLAPDHDNGSGERPLHSSEQILQQKRAAAIASLTQKRGASAIQVSSHKNGVHGGAAASSGSPQRTNVTVDQLSHLRKSTSLGSSTSSKQDHSLVAGRLATDDAVTNYTAPSHEIEEKKPPNRTASSADIDGLLAEGRAAAEAPDGNEEPDSTVEDANVWPISQTSQQEKNLKTVTRKEVQRKQEVETANHSNGGLEALPKDNSGSRSESPEIGEILPLICQENSTPSILRKIDKRAMSKPDPRSTSRQGSLSHPDRPIYEPPRKQSADVESNHVNVRNSSTTARSISTRDSKLATGKSLAVTRNDPGHEFSHLQPHEVEELREWLIVTRYYDENYRRKAIHRHKRLAALEQEKADLMKEEQDEREALTNTAGHPQSSILSGLSTAPLCLPSPSIQAHSISSVHHMPPPTTTPQTNTDAGKSKSLRTRKDSDTGLAEEFLASEASRAPKTPTLKKHLSGPTSDDGHDDRAEKVARTDGTDRHGGTNTYREDFVNKSRREALQRPPPYNSKHLPHQNHDLSPNASAYWANDSDVSHQPDSANNEADWRSGSEYRVRGSAYWHGRGRGRGRARYGGAIVRGPSFNHPRSNYRSGSELLNLGAGNVRYFMVKSLTYDNVDAAQREGTWVTQIKNVEKFAEAFDTCRHVILVFSVNSSKAFQGYARMETIPGDKGVPPPSWLKHLSWEASPPFRIKWFNVAETRFRYVGHLKNSYNEGAPVLFGRDGQEIEAECGFNLCSILDEAMPHT